jgi:hypothetical protein
MEFYWATAIGFYPTAKDAATGKDDRMWPVEIDDSHF